MNYRLTILSPLNRTLYAVLALILITAPITGGETIQQLCQLICPETLGYLVTGQLDDPDCAGVPVGIRILCPDLQAVHEAVNRFKSLRDLDFSLSEQYADSWGGTLIGWGTAIEHEQGIIELQTIQQTRWQIWRNRVSCNHPSEDSLLHNYSRAVSKYLYEIDAGNMQELPPIAVTFGLPDSLDLYAEPPYYVIQGYQNYKDFLHENNEIKTDFAKGILAFVPTAATLNVMKADAPRKLFSNKEAAMIQHEYKKFYERGGDMRSMQTLTSIGFDTLKTGEYFFAVNRSYKIRFGREFLREEVMRIEEESGRKVPRANHAFLFPGEKIRTAGAFFLDERDENKLVKVNAQSGHYFYSNITPTIREDISQESNAYLTTLGHFFIALDSAGIDYRDITIWKF